MNYFVKAIITPADPKDGGPVDTLIPAECIASFERVLMGNVYRYKCHFKKDLELGLPFKVGKIEADAMEGSIMNKLGILL